MTSSESSKGTWERSKNSCMKMYQVAGSVWGKHVHSPHSAVRLILELPINLPVNPKACKHVLCCEPGVLFMSIHPFAK